MLGLRNVIQCYKNHLSLNCTKGTGTAVRRDKTFTYVAVEQMTFKTFRYVQNGSEQTTADFQCEK